MLYFLFFFYLAVGCFFINKIRFIKNSELSNGNILLLFIVKIAAGIVFGYMLLRVYPGNDAWALNEYGRQEYQLLVKHPAVFFSDIFKSNYGENYGSLFGSSHSYWNDLKLNFLIKIVALLNIFSRGNYYINSLFFNFLCFIGHIALYRVFINIYPCKKWMVITGCILLPSALFFSSGLDKDCIVFALLCLLCYSLYFSLKRGFNLKKSASIFLCAALLFIIRNYVVVIFILPMLAWIFCKKYHVKAGRTFLAVFLFTFICLLFIQSFLPGISPLNIIVQKQQDFYTIHIANTQLATDTLMPTIKSFMVAAPKAFAHVFTEPHPFEFSATILNIFSIEVLGYWGLFILMLFYFHPSKQNDPFIFFSIVFALTMMLFIGYIVPNAGSIIRYRSIYLPFLITPVLCSIKLKPNKY
ncbi:MAG: hypothetical protein JSU03_02630 [Bacteroidetes bacterium]|nr:hypothetical protein [Bacteroidota bacterium]MBS1756154.1 hypothetical protein [Bacteroidota bacterium]